MKRWGWTPHGMCVSEKEQLQFVHYSDYEKLVEALRRILHTPRVADIKEHAEAALLSAGEKL